MSPSNTAHKRNVILLFLLAVALVVGLSWWVTKDQVKPNLPIEYDRQVEHLVLQQPVGSDTSRQAERITHIHVNDITYHVGTYWLKPELQGTSGQSNFDAFYQGEHILHQAQFYPSHIVTESGAIHELSFQPRKLRDYPLVFWLSRIEAMLMMFFSLWVYAIAPKQKGAWAAVIGSFGLSVAFLVADTSVARAWALPVGQFQTFATLSAVTGIISFVTIFYLAWHLPKPLIKHPVGQYVPWLALCILCGLYALYEAGVIPDLVIAFELPYVLVTVLAIVILIYKFVLYWVHRKRDILEWTVMRWVMLATLFGVTIPLVCHVLVHVGWLASMPSFALDSIVIFKIGLSALVASSIIYQIESLWWRLWVILVGAGVLFTVGFVLRELLAVSSSIAWLSALVCGIVAGFGMRLYFKRRYVLSRSQLLDNTLPKLIHMVGAPAPDQQGKQTHVAPETAWRDVLRETFQPLQFDVTQKQATDSVAHIQQGGVMLSVPDMVAGQAVEIRGAYHGMRLFTQKDVELVTYFWNIITQSQKAQNAYREGEKNERKRIAADLHDDIGGKLLYLAGGQGDYGKYAHETLQDLRMLARGLSSENKCFGDVLADLNYQLAEKCDLADVLFTSEIVLGDVTQESIPTRSATLLNSVVYELVRNALKHTRTSRIHLSISDRDGQVILTVSNDGADTEPKDWVNGMGIPTVKRRIHDIQGQVTWRSQPDGGVCCELSFPLQQWLLV